MKQFECPYSDECGLLCNQTNENCRIKELFEDFYKVEKLYIEANAKCKQLKQLRQKNRELKKDLKNVEKDRAWIKERCIDAGKELGKHSFAWDGKEKNLVVQAMELNERYEKLKAENEDLKQKLEKIKGIASAIVYGTHFTNDIEGHLKELVKDILEIIVGEE